MSDTDSKTLVLSPIGYLRSTASEKYEAPRQPGVGQAIGGVIELLSHHNYEQALADLDGFERIWVLFQFDRNRAWKPKVMPPRGGVKRGVFATRSPHRPNPIGMSCVPLVKVEGRRVLVGAHDMLDGTPVLDIKPYVAYADSFPEASQGWLEGLEVTSGYKIHWSADAKEQAEHLREQCGLDLERGVAQRLQESPFPYPNARIRHLGEDLYELAYQTWRLLYRAVEAEDTVTVERVSSGYSPEALAEVEDKWGDKEVHRGFVRRFQ